MLQAKEILGNIELFAINNRNIDYVYLEWHETAKRILHKRTAAGREIALRFLGEQHQLHEGDIVYEDDFNLIVVEILPCDVIVIRPRTLFETASICFEIGNKHIPLFFKQEELQVAFDAPLMAVLKAGNYDVERTQRKLLRPLKTTVQPHGNNSESFFTRILKKTATPG